MTEQLQVVQESTSATTVKLDQSLQDVKSYMDSLVHAMAGNFRQSLVGEDASVQEKQRQFEETHQILQDTLTRVQTQRSKSDNFRFPFVIMPRDDDGPVDALENVKLDSSFHDNWIGKHVLERCNIQFEPTDESKPHTSTGQDQYRAVGRVNLSWYLKNQALAKETAFLVGEELPFDAILGGDLIMEAMNTVDISVFHLRWISPPSEAYRFRLSQERG